MPACLAISLSAQPCQVGAEAVAGRAAEFDDADRILAGVVGDGLDRMPVPRSQMSSATLVR